MKYAVIAAFLAVARAEDPAPADDPPATDPPATDPAPACTVKVEVFTDEACTTAKEGDQTAVGTAWNDKVKSAACTAAGDDFVKNTCDGAGLTSALFTDDACATAKKDGDADVSTTWAWGACTKVGEDYLKMTGARALMVGVAASLAIVGAQF